MKSFWLNLNRREQLLLGAGAVFFVIYLFYLCFLSPLFQAVTRSKKELLEKKQTLLWMQDILKKKNTQPGREKLQGAKRLSVLSSQLSEETFKKFPYQLQQKGAEEIQLSFEQVPFNAFLEWFWQFNLHYEVVLKKISIERKETEGLVKVVLIFS